MSNPAVETKIELVTEAIEALVLATAHSVGMNGISARDAFENVVAARKEVASALRELLTPTLRVMTNDKMPVKPEVVLYGGIGIDGMNLA